MFLTRFPSVCRCTQLIEDWIRGVITNRNGGEVVDKSQVTLIWAVAVAIFCFGGMIGGLATGVVAEKFGRKGGLLVSNVLVIVSAALQGKCVRPKRKFDRSSVYRLCRPSMNVIRYRVRDKSKSFVLFDRKSFIRTVTSYLE